MNAPTLRKHVIRCETTHHSYYRLKNLHRWPQRIIIEIYNGKQDQIKSPQTFPKIFSALSSRRLKCGSQKENATSKRTAIRLATWYGLEITAAVPAKTSPRATGHSDSWYAYYIGFSSSTLEKSIARLALYQKDSHSSFCYPPKTESKSSSSPFYKCFCFWTSLSIHLLVLDTKYIYFFCIKQSKSSHQMISDVLISISKNCSTDFATVDNLIRGWLQFPLSF